MKETGTRRDKVRGVDRSSDDLTPKNLTKKLKRSSGPKKVVIEDIDEDTKDKKPKKDVPAGEGKPKPSGAKPEAKAEGKPEAKEAPKDGAKE